MKSCFSFDRVNSSEIFRFTADIFRFSTELPIFSDSVPILCVYRIRYRNRCGYLRGGYDSAESNPNRPRFRTMVLGRSPVERQHRHIVRRSVECDEWLIPINLDFLSVCSASNRYNHVLTVTGRNTVDGGVHCLEVVGYSE